MLELPREKVTREKFIGRCKIIHRDFYDYSRVKFDSTADKVSIICPTHGEFTQQVKVHLRGSGCPDCGLIKKAENRRLSVEEVLKRFKDKHGDFYSYDKMNYVNTQTKITIVCHLHGDFVQTPEQHFISTGCEGCQDNSWSEESRKRNGITVENFIERSVFVHGNFYDYSKVSFRIFSDQVKIICPKHGVFKQVAKRHMQGNGCTKCGYERTSAARSLTYENFIERSRTIHGQNRYSYVKDSWKRASEKVEIICPKHGSFLQTPHSHLQGAGCPDCGVIKRSQSKRLTTEQAIKIFRSVHGSKYDYSQYIHTTHRIKSTIICPLHGEFLQSTSNHRAGKGCPECKNDAIGDALRKPINEVIKDFKEIHGDVYDYSFVPGDYQNSDIPVTIVCPKHGEFSQAPYNHLMGKGCPKCRESNGEREVRRVLETRSIDFLYEWKDHDCILKRPLKFDFYIPSLNILIEYDGEQHFEPNARWWSSDKEKNLQAFQELQMRDKMKTEWAIKNGYNLLRIRYDDELEETLNDFIDEVID